MRRKELIFLLCGLVMAVCFSFLFTPVNSSGDSPDYIRYAQKILGDATSDSFSHRSPLYSLFLALFLRIFGPDNYIRIVVVVQFILSYITSILVYFMFFRILRRRSAALIISLFSFFSLSSIYYSYTILSEVLSQFIFVLSVYLILLFLRSRKTIQLLFLGLFVSFLNLSRFNTIPVTLVFMVIILIEGVRSFGIKRGIKNSFIFITMPFLVLTGLAFFNYLNEKSFYIFPSGGSEFVSRNAVLASLEGDEEVSIENKPVFDIFLRAKGAVDLEIIKPGEGSLLKIDKAGVTVTLYKGYKIYKSAYSDLCDYYEIEPSKAESILSLRLAGFYDEIISQNKGTIFLYRCYSFLNSFRSASGLTFEKGNNLGCLPQWMIIFYKTLIICVSVFTFITSVIVLVLAAIKKISISHEILIIILLCYSFYLINFAFGTMGDANRFKFPTNPLITGLAVVFTEVLLIKLTIPKSRFTKNALPETKQE